MPSATIASPAASADFATRKAPAFFVRSVEKVAALRAALLVAPPQPRTPRARRRFGLLLDATRRGGLRVVCVFERERLAAFDASLVREVRADREHYLPWARLAATPATAGAKLRALLSRPATAPERPEKMPVTTATAATA